MEKTWYWHPNKTEIIKYFLTIAKKASRIVYLVGNHDEFLRPLIPQDLYFDKIEITNKTEYTSLNGKKYLIVHGDQFDNAVNLPKFMYYWGDRLYSALIRMNKVVNWFRSLFGQSFWSLSAYLKHRTKKAMNFVANYEKSIVELCKSKKFDGIICGHIHQAAIKKIDDIEYMNSGDWIETCSALVEHLDGRWEIIYWK